MQCNIDAKGKALRLISGLIVTLIAIVMLVLLLIGTLQGPWLWTIAVIALLLGAFQIFEARKGWCIVRAMGIKTPI